MKIWLSHAPGPPSALRLEEAPPPEIGPGELLISVRAVGVNYPDRLIVEDRYQLRPPRPFAPCGEAAGLVEAVGAEVRGFRPGDRVAALTLWGALAERIAAPAERCVLLPPEMSFETAAAFPMVQGTAWHALVERGGLKSGETLLVLGAAGGVGLAAVELGAALGARVVAAASSPAKLEAAMQAGASDGLVYPADLQEGERRDLAARFKSLCGPSGADVVLDPVGGAYSEPALRAMAWGGRFLVVGFPAGIAAIPLNLPLLKGCDLRGVFWGEALNRDPDAFRRQMSALFDLWSQGRLRPRLHAAIPFARAPEALDLLETRGVLGKLVVSLP